MSWVRARIAALVALALLWLAMLLWGAGPLDRQLYELLYAGRRPALVAAARFATAFGEPNVLVAASAAFALWLWYARKPRLALAMFAVVMTGRGLAEIQKYWVARVRPDAEPHLVVVKTSSFPSGHAANSMIFYLVLALVLTAGSRWQRPALAAAVLVSLLIGTSRVVLGVHWPSDVVGGWAFGMMWVLLTLRLSKQFSATGFGPRA